MFLCLRKAGLLAMAALWGSLSIQAAIAAYSPKKCTELPVARQMHGSAVVGDRLYVFGGGEDVTGWTDSVISADIDPAKGLGQWKPERPMPDRRHYIGNSVEVVNNRIYVVGGSVAASSASLAGTVQSRHDVVWTSVQPDGTLAPWRTSAPFPGPDLSNLATCSTDDRLYVSGGQFIGGVSDTVLCAEFAPDGEPRNWRAVAKLPSPLWFHGTAVLDRRMYAWGGLTEIKSTSVFPRTVSAPIEADGSLGPWRDEAALANPMYSSAFCGFNDHLVSVTGRTSGGAPSSDLAFARLDATGRLGPWTRLTTDMAANAYHTVGLDRSRGWVFAPGGRHKSGSGQGSGYLVKEVRGFKIASDGPPPPPVAAPAADGAAVALAAAAGKRQLLYFRSPQVPACIRFERDVMASEAFRRASAGLELTTVDTARDAALCYKYSVFRVPSLVVVGTDGSPRRSKALSTAEEASAFLAGP